MKMLYVNGDSHTQRCYGSLHPTSTELLAKEFGLQYQNHALAGGSNQRIIRTTLEHLPGLDSSKTVIVIGWSSFERTEWFYDNAWHQICGQSVYNVDPDLKNIWDIHINQWLANENKTQFRLMQEQHHAIWCFHLTLKHLGYQHLFYQGCDTAFFDGCPEQDLPFKMPWDIGVWAHDPYIKVTEDNQRFLFNFSRYAKEMGCNHTDQWAHYGADAHILWANYLRPLLQQKIDCLP